MSMINCRRRESREQLNPPEMGVLYSESAEYIPGTTLTIEPDVRFVDIVDQTAAGVSFSTSKILEPGTSIRLGVYACTQQKWHFFSGDIKWTREHGSHPDVILAGAQLRESKQCRWPVAGGLTIQNRMPLFSDYQFLISTDLFQSVPREAVCWLLNCLQFKEARQGERIIRQGDEGDGLYLIQSGVCTANVEKEGRLHTVARLKSGDIFGEMAILTGEPRSSHVDAETDMSLWYLNRQSFNTIAHRFPDMREFLTALLTSWIEERTLTASRTIGRYTIQDIIGRGGFSIVYRGEHAGLKLPVAIKMLKHDMAMDPDFLSQFTAEAKTIARLNHENIVRVYDIENRYSTIFIIMEYLSGQTLKTQLQTMMRLPVNTALNYLLQISAGLKYAHTKGIVHQDIKPGNIFLLHNGCLKIVDFGLSCPCGTDSFFSGTPDYMSPEQVECLPVDERTDIYALGLVAYEMLIGQRPFQAENQFAAINHRLEKDIPETELASGNLPQPLCSFIKKACARDPAQRFQNVDEVLDVLAPLAELYDIYPGQRLLHNRQMAALYFFYDDHQRTRLIELVRDITVKAKKSGIDVKTS